jgi:hypothetical protein
VVSVAAIRRQSRRVPLSRTLVALVLPGRLVLLYPRSFRV